MGNGNKYVLSQAAYDRLEAPEKELFDLAVNVKHRAEDMILQISSQSVDEQVRKHTARVMKNDASEAALLLQFIYFCKQVKQDDD